MLPSYGILSIRVYLYKYSSKITSKDRRLNTAVVQMESRSQRNSQRPYSRWMTRLIVLFIMYLAIVSFGGFPGWRISLKTPSSTSSRRSAENDQTTPRIWQCLVDQGNHWPQSMPFDPLDTSGRYINSVPTLDGGGREMILSLLDASSTDGLPTLLIEIGIFMGGSALAWLQRTDVNYYGIDVGSEEANDWRAEYIKSDKWFKSWFDENKDASTQYLANFRKQSGYKSTLESTLWQYRDRSLLNLEGSPHGLKPLLDCFNAQKDKSTQVVFYLDSDKEYYEMYLIYMSWPNVLVTGDDWTWGDGIVQVKLCTLATRLGLTIFADQSTWVALKQDQLQWKDKVIISGGKECDCQAVVSQSQ